jgi:hypothetical protein
MTRRLPRDVGMPRPVGYRRAMGRRLRPASLYPRARGSVLVPLALFGLPEWIEVRGVSWALKDEFHVTAANTSWLAQRTGVSLERAWQEVSGALEGRRAGPVRIGDELRLARDGEERTLIVMVGVDGIGALYTELSGRLGAPLAPPPTHITLYTRPGGEAIGVHDESELRSLTEPLRGRHAAEIRDAIRFDALLAS